jgi:hypothetical protein
MHCREPLEAEAIGAKGCVEIPHLPQFPLSFPTSQSGGAQIRATPRSARSFAIAGVAGGIPEMMSGFCAAAVAPIPRSDQVRVPADERSQC